MRPHVICHMSSPIDGKLDLASWTRSADGSKIDRSAIFDAAHEALRGDAWLVGRVTIAEFTDVGAHPPAEFGAVARPSHFARRDADAYAIALDTRGEIHWDRTEIGGDHIVMVLGSGVSDAHLAELAADGVSYIVSDDAEIDLAAMLRTLRDELGVQRLILEGDAVINGAFLSAGLVDEFSLLVVPAVDGRADRPGIVDTGAAGLLGEISLSLESCERRAEGTVHLRYSVDRN